MVQLTEQIVKAKTRIDRLDQVKNLNLWGQDLDDVRILDSLKNVEVLSLSVNRIHSLKDFSSCTKLQELYLRKNEINDLTDVAYLQPLASLKVLWLSDNPCAERPDYRATVIRALPGLTKLDNDEVTAAEREAALHNASGVLGQGASSDKVPPHTVLHPLAAATPMSTAGSPGGLPQVPGSPATGSSTASLLVRAPSGPSLLSPALSGSGDGCEQRGPSLVAGRRGTKSILYAVMALVVELDDEDLVLIKREIEARLAGNH